MSFTNSSEPKIERKKEEKTLSLVILQVDTKKPKQKDL